MNFAISNNYELNFEEKSKYFVHPGHFFVSRKLHILSAVLGSCVAVCLWDPALKFGGMNHYIHAKPFDKSNGNDKFGALSIVFLIKIMDKMGSQSCNLKAHIVGGAQGSEMKSSLAGKENVLIAEKLLKKYHIDIVSFDTGGKFGRKLFFDTETGDISVYNVNKLS